MSNPSKIIKVNEAATPWTEPSVIYPYYQQQLDLLYTETKRPSVYQVKVRHTVDCTCCYRGPDDIVDRSGPKTKVGLGRKAGGVNK
jgi:hypothetical protein